MKKTFIIIFTLLVSSSIFAEGDMKKEVTDSFTDKIHEIKAENTDLRVTFKKHAAVYKMLASNPRFEELKVRLEKLKQESKKVKITAVVPSMEIKDVTE